MEPPISETTQMAEVTGLSLLEIKTQNTDDLGANTAIALMLITDQLETILATGKDVKLLDEDVLTLAPMVFRAIADESDRKAGYASLFHDLWTFSHVTPQYLTDSWHQLAEALDGYRQLKQYLSYDEMLHIRDNFRPLIAWTHQLSLKVVDKRLGERQLDHEGGRVSQELDQELFGYLCDMYLDYEDYGEPTTKAYLNLSPETCRRLKAEAHYFYATAQD